MRLHGVKALYQVAIAVIVMFAHSGMNAAFCFSYQQFITCKQVKEFISSHQDIVLFKKWLKHDE